MIIGVGLDMVQIERIGRWRGIPGLLNRYFHPDELAGATGKGADASLAARFAAKEAFGKALGSGMAGLVLKDIAVRTLPGGKPTLVLFGTAQAAFTASGATTIHLSLTHEGPTALAIVILEAPVPLKGASS